MSRKLAGAAVLIGAVMILLGGADLASAGTQTFSGTLAPGDTTWDRPYCDGSLEGSIEFYDQQTFFVTADGNYDITMPTLTGTTSPDGYFLLYQGSFDATSPDTNCIAEDDDSGAGLAPAIAGVALVANTNYVLVTTQCCDGTTVDEGIAYTNDITGPGEIVLGAFQIPTTTTTTSTTATTVAPTTATTAAVAPSTTARVLARTGSSNGQLSLLGVALVAGGTGVLVAARRRAQFSAATST